jgi:RNA polymerase sigma-70 factor (ECF subfamily)
MNAQDQDLWDGAIRQHDRQVLLSLLALGLPPDRAREISQSAWTALMEKHSDGGLAELRLPGLAIRQARFLALNSLRRDQTEQRTLKAVPAPSAEPDVERVVMSREQLDRALDALAGCSPTAKKIFRLAYTEPHMPHADVARAVGLSLQRVRQILCETRKHLRHAIEGEDQ